MGEPVRKVAKIDQIIFSKEDYDRFLVNLEKQETQFDELLQQNKNLKIQLQAKKNLQRLLRDKHFNIGRCENDLRMAHYEINNLKRLIEKMGGSGNEESTAARLDTCQYERDEDSDAESVDFEGEDIDDFESSSKIITTVQEGGCQMADTSKIDNVPLRDKSNEESQSVCSGPVIRCGISHDILQQVTNEREALFNENKILRSTADDLRKQVRIKDVFKTFDLGLVTSFQYEVMQCV